MNMTKKRMNLLEQWIIGALLLIIALFVAVFLLLNAATKPFENTKKAAIVLAEQKGNLVKPQGYDIATTDTTNYAVTGLDSNDQEIGVLIPKDSGTLTIVKLADGVKPATLQEKNTENITLAMYKGNPAWEVNNSDGYKVYDFKTGKLLQG